MSRLEIDLSGMVNVAVSKHMSDLSAHEARLNRFVWSTEASYAYVLNRLAHHDQSADASAALDVPSRAWEKNHGGRTHFRGTLGVFLSTLRENMPLVYGAAMLHYFGAFALYLQSRSGAYRRLSSDRGINLIGGCKHLCQLTECAVPLEILLRADASRLLRNIVAHQEDVPRYIGDRRIVQWRQRTYSNLVRYRWPGNFEKIITTVEHSFFGRVCRMAKKSSLPALHFYSIFSFSNLSNLAFAIEESLYDPSLQHGEYSIRRQGKFIRRQEMIVPSEISPPVP